jgi:RHS repeat-associated protein
MTRYRFFALVLATLSGFLSISGHALAQGWPPEPCPNTVAECSQGLALATAQAHLAAQKGFYGERGQHIFATPIPPGSEFTSYQILWADGQSYHVSWYRATTFPGLPDNPCNNPGDSSKCTRAMARGIADRAFEHKVLESPSGAWYVADIFNSTSKEGYFCVVRTVPGWQYGCYFVVYFSEALAGESKEDLGCGASTLSPSPITSPLVGNPINCSTANKFAVELDLTDGALDFVRYYNSARGARFENVGLNWTHTYSRSVRVRTDGTTNVAEVFRPKGEVIEFVETSGNWVADPNETAVLQKVVVDGVHTGWVFTQIDGRETEEFDAQGRLIAIRRADGNDVALGYTDANLRDMQNLLLTSVSDASGRKLVLQYDTKRNLAAVYDDSGSGVEFDYDSSFRLVTATYADASVRTYLYNESANTGGATLPWALTGIIDENGNRFATYKYDSSGRAISTEHAGGTERYVVNYSTPNAPVVTGPDGETRTFTTVDSFGKKVASAVSIACAGCVTRTTTGSMDANGRLDVETSPAGVTTDYDFDSRGRLTKLVEAANDTTGIRRISQVDWHAAFAVPTERRIYDGANTLVAKSNWTYNSRGQVLTAAQIDPTNPIARTTTYAYCESSDVAAINSTCPILGLLKSVDGPISGTSDTTTFSYRSAHDLAGCETSGSGNCHRKGDLWKVTDGFGHETVIERYDLAGRITQAHDANGVVTRLAYDARGRMTTRTVFGPNSGVSTDDAISTIEYDDLGQVVKMTDPEGAFVEFTYDAAHRLERIEDGLGNSIEYSLDAAGNIYQEDSRDSGNTLRRTMNRLFDDFGQLETLADADANATDFTYDAAGNLDTATDALGRITDNDYDALGRLRKTIANTAGSGGERAVSEFAYDALDRLTTVEDPNGLLTNYDYDGLGNLVELASPDTGTTTYGYDIAGRRTSSLDARGVASAFSYDRLNRLTGIDRPTAGQDSTFTYDTAPSVCDTGETFAVGRLGTMTDPSGSTAFCYDRRGNLVRKVQAVTGATADLTVRYGYTLADRVTTITYPSGATVTYTRDATGRITGVSGQPTVGATAVTLISDVDYLPFGPANVITFGNGRTLTKSYDQNYGIDAVTDSASGGLSIDLGLDDVGNVTSIDERLTGGITAARTVAYDGLDRLESLDNGATPQQAFTYDATGNRLAKTTPGSTATYGYAANSHKLTSDGVQSRTVDAAGHGTAIGTRTFVYDDSGRMVEMRDSGTLTRSYRHNARGERVAKLHPTTSASDIFYVYDEAGHLLGEYRGDGTAIREIVWMDDVPVAVFTSHAGTTYQYIFSDHLNTPRTVVLPTTNAIVWRWDLTSSAFGEHAVDGNPDGDANSYTLNLRYPGQLYDAESGLHYNYFRDYDPATGRYLQSDPIGLRGGQSTYGYTAGQPLKYSDPLGLAFGLSQSLAGIRSQGPVSFDAPGHYAQERVLPGALDLALRLSRGEFIMASDEENDGDNDCAELIKIRFDGAPHSSQWRAIRPITEGMTIAPGTFIFTPNEMGRFGQGKDDWRHAAVFVAFSDRGILVLDQYDPQPGLQYRELRWSYGSGEPHADFVNSASNFWTGGW